MATTTLKIGSVLQGKEYTYTIKQVLGQGSFGITYLAETKVSVTGALGKLNTSATIQVAIKEFFLQDISVRTDDGSLSAATKGSLFVNYGKKFQKEALNLSHLNHPNIVNVLELFESNNTYYYSMEFIEGFSLDDYIKQNTSLQEQEALKYFTDIAQALQYMHSQKMLHLDLKPKNIMLDRDNKAVLIDFGLSKQYSDNGEPESSTTIGLGTPGYAPVEQDSMSGKEFAPTIDIYALGATLYKMLSGKTPPKASAVLNYGLNTQLLKDKNISERTIALIEKCMMPMKAKRPQNITEVLSLLNNKTENKEEDTHIIKTITTKVKQNNTHRIPATAKEDDTIPKKKPIKYKDTTPIEDDDTIPLKYNNTTPTENDDTIPIKYNNTTPIEDDDTIPIKYNNTTPIIEEDTIPLKEQAIYTPIIKQSDRIRQQHNNIKPTYNKKKKGINKIIEKIKKNRKTTILISIILGILLLLFILGIIGTHINEKTVLNILTSEWQPISKTEVPYSIKNHMDRPIEPLPPELECEDYIQFFPNIEFFFNGEKYITIFDMIEHRCEMKDSVYDTTMYMQCFNKNEIEHIYIDINPYGLADSKSKIFNYVHKDDTFFMVEFSYEFSFIPLAHAFYCNRAYFYLIVESDRVILLDKHFNYIKDVPNLLPIFKNIDIKYYSEQFKYRHYDIAVDI